jgi:hypothetical protein
MRRLAFIACEGNGMLLVMNLDTRQVISSYAGGKGERSRVFRII